MLAPLLRRHPHVRGILVDLPGTVARASEILTGAGVADRVTLAGQSFFDPLPAGADLYLLKSVLNDWPDEATVAILRRCAQAAGSTGPSGPPSPRATSPCSAASHPTTHRAPWASTCWSRAVRPVRSPSSPTWRGEPGSRSWPPARRPPAASWSSAAARPAGPAEAAQATRPAGPAEAAGQPLTRRTRRSARTRSTGRGAQTRKTPRPSWTRKAIPSAWPATQRRAKRGIKLRAERPRESTLPNFWLHCNAVIIGTEGSGRLNMEAGHQLDAYSRIVSGVAERLTPRVASLRVPRRGSSQGSRGGTGESLGSAVVFTGDGFLLTNAHVVGRAERRHRGVLRRHLGPVPRGGRRPAVRPGGAARQRRDPGAGRARRGRPARRRPARGGGRQPARPGRLGHGRRGQRARPVAAGPRPA